MALTLLNKPNKSSYTFTTNILLLTVASADLAQKFSFGGSLNANTIAGTWGEGQNTSGGGTFSITKQ
jgi:hypothetical protein